jgi:hypothetical protein
MVHLLLSEWRGHQKFKSITELSIGAMLMTILNSFDLAFLASKKARECSYYETIDYIIFVHNLEM